MSKKKEEDITVVFCTRETDHEKMEGFMDMLQKTAGCEITISMVSNPDGVSLSQVYGDVLESDYIQSDIVVFVHDDIEFLRDGWGTELIRLFKENKKYGIIGVAGSASLTKTALGGTTKSASVKSYIGMTESLGSVRSLRCFNMTCKKSLS